MLDNPKHSSKSQDWYSPTSIIEASRSVMGSIDLDPASSYVANGIVGATHYYTKEDNGLVMPWYGNIYLNPPGGKLDGKSLPKLFWQKLMYSPKVTQAIFLAFSIELLQTSQLSDVPPATDFIICIPKRRLAFIDATGKPVKGNTHASAIIGYNVDYSLFTKTFRPVGSILEPSQAY